MSRYAKLSGIAGVVVCGAARDTQEIVELRFPVFASAVTPLSGHHRVEVVSAGAPAKCGTVIVQKGYLVVADRDGVVVVSERLVSEVLDRVAKLQAKEKEQTVEMRNRLRSKLNSASRKHS